MPNLRRSMLGVSAGLAVAVGAVLLLDPGIGAEARAAGLESAQPVFLLLALLCTGVALLTDAWSLLVLARVFKPTAARGRVMSIALESQLLGGVTSFGGLEIPYQIVMLKRNGLTGAEATAVVVVKGFVHILLLAVVALMALLPWIASPVTSIQSIVVVAVAAVLLALWLVWRFGVRDSSSRTSAKQGARARVEKLVDAVRLVGRGSPRNLVALLVLQVAHWAAMFAILLFVLLALGWHGAVMPVVTGQAVIQVLMPLSPLPGGAGIAEVSYLALIGPLTAPVIHVSSLVLWRVFTWVVPVAVGAAFFGIRALRLAGGLRSDRYIPQSLEPPVQPSWGDGHGPG